MGIEGEEQGEADPPAFVVRHAPAHERVARQVGVAKVVLDLLEHRMCLIVALRDAPSITPLDRAHSA